MCGRYLECDPHSKEPRCVDFYGHSHPGDLGVSCKRGKYFEKKGTKQNALNYYEFKN